MNRTQHGQIICAAAASATDKRTNPGLFGTCGTPSIQVRPYCFERRSRIADMTWTRHLRNNVVADFLNRLLWVSLS